MSLGVVNGLKVIKINEQHSQRTNVPRLSRTRMLDSVDEESTVGQAGERIVERLMRHLFLKLLAHRNILHGSGIGIIAMNLS